jgi:hypothetical protein
MSLFSCHFSFTSKRYAHENGCEWDEKCWENLLHDHIAKYLQEEGCPRPQEDGREIEEVESEKETSEEEEESVEEKGEEEGGEGENSEEEVSKSEGESEEESEESEDEGVEYDEDFYEDDFDYDEFDEMDRRVTACDVKKRKVVALKEDGGQEKKRKV